MSTEISEAVECPQCGDTFGARDNLRGHVNASADHPSWAEIQSLLEEEQGAEQAPTRDDQGGDQAESGDCRDPDTRDSQADEQAEGSGKRQKGPQAGSNEQGESVPTEQELERQRQQAGTDQAEPGDSRDLDTRDDQADEQAEGASEGTLTAGSALALPGVAVLEDLDTTTLALLGALLLVVVIAWYYLGDSRDVRGPSGAPEGPSEGGRRDGDQDDTGAEDDEVTLIE
jgi:hypothetical protein